MEAADDRGFLSRRSVQNCFRRIRQVAHNEGLGDDTEATQFAPDSRGKKKGNVTNEQDAIDQLLDALDVANSEEVDFRALVSGLSVSTLCSRRRGEHDRLLVGYPKTYPLVDYRNNTMQNYALSHMEPADVDGYTVYVCCYCCIAPVYMRHFPPCS